MNFDSFTTKDMLNLVDKNFYNLFPTKRKFMNFVRTFVNKFCEENNVFNVAIEPRPFSHYSMYYVASRRIIYLSNFYVQKYEEFAHLKNYYFLNNFFDSLIHEMRHHIQYTSTETTPILKNYSILSFNFDSRQVLDKIPYPARPLELDARYFAYKYLKDFKFFSPYYKMEAFIEDEKSVNYNYYTLVELLKDKDFAKIKYLTHPKRALESCIKQIAIKNGLRLADSSKQEEINMSISKEIAPDFFSDEFLASKNPKRLENELNDQRNEFIDYFENFRCKKNDTPDDEKT